jgi:hypothetical protein
MAANPYGAHQVDAHKPTAWPDDPCPAVMLLGVPVGGSEHSSGIGCWILPATACIEQLGGVESENRARRDADAFTRNCA